MSIRSFVVSTVVAVLAIAGGCSKESDSTPVSVTPTSTQSTTVTSSSAPAVKPRQVAATAPAPAPEPVITIDFNLPITAEECVAFGKQLEVLIQNRDIRAVNALIAWNAMLERAVDGVKASDKLHDSFVNGFMKELQRTGGMGSDICNAARQGGSYKVLRVHQADGAPRILARFILANDAGINYHDLVLAKSTDGQLRIIDVYVFATGELLSTTFRRGYLPIVANENPDQLSDWEKSYTQNLPTIQQMAKQLEEGNAAESLATFDSLPDELKSDKNLLMYRVRAAQAVSDEQYAAALATLQATYPNDACTLLLSIDAHFLNGNFAEAIAAVDRLDQAVGGDPYLLVMRSGIYLEAGDVAQAKTSAVEAVVQDDSLIDAYWTLGSVSLMENDFDSTLRVLTTLEDKFGIEMQDLNKVPAYADFVQSPQYQQWIGRNETP